MPSVILHVHAHLPLPLRRYSFFDIGHSHDYFDREQSRRDLEQMAVHCCLPANLLLLKLIRRHRGSFRISCSISGMLLEQLVRGQRGVLESFQKLADTGCVEFLGMPYHHSPASLYSVREFRTQIALHRRKIRTLFGQTPRAFRNTEGIGGRDMTGIVESMGFRVFLAGGAGRSECCDETVLYRHAGSKHMKVLFRHGTLLEELSSLRTGNAGSGRAATAAGFADRIAESCRGRSIVTLSIDYGAIGMNGGGMHEFLESLPGTLMKKTRWRFRTLSEAVEDRGAVDSIDMPEGLIESGREGGAVWLENHLQKDAANMLYAQEGPLRESGKRKLTGIWRTLQASDYFRYMCTKGPSDGAGLRGFNPFPSPYDAYIAYMNILKDFSGQVSGNAGFRT